MSVRDWCKAEGINTKTYYRHERMILDMLPVPKEGKQVNLPTAVTPSADAKLISPAFVPLPVPKQRVDPSGQVAATVRIMNCSVDIYDGASEETLRTLLRVLNHAE